MKPVLRNLTAVVVGFAVGSAINMSLIMVGPLLVPPPDLGATVGETDMEALAASMHLFGPQHFIFPFLAHAVGTLVGSIFAYLIAASRKTSMSYIVGLLFLFGGAWVATQLPSPLWFDVLDLSLAYLPMAAIGILLARSLSHRLVRTPP